MKKKTRFWIVFYFFVFYNKKRIFYDKKRLVFYTRDNTSEYTKKLQLLTLHINCLISN